ncbi:hypothetical protein LINPERHAP1_LOCUS23323 [Linum perenne]
MRFTYVVAGWERSAHDAKILSSTVSSQSFQEIRRRGGPKGREELFNYKHSSLRSVIQRKQRDIVLACCAIHNFIRMHAQGDSLFAEFEESDGQAETSESVARIEFGMSSS